MIDRNLEIALVSAALVLEMGYDIGRRIFEVLHCNSVSADSAHR